MASKFDYMKFIKDLKHYEKYHKCPRLQKKLADPDLH